MINTELTIERLPLSQLIPAPYNPRKITPSAIAALEESMKRFGVNAPIIWNKRTGHVVSGHQRLVVLNKHLKPTDVVPVVVVDCDDNDERLMNLAHNNPRAQGRFDFTMLSEWLPELSDTMQDEMKALALEHLCPEFDTNDGAQPLTDLEYKIIIDCPDEETQRDLLARFEKEGISCRALIS